jgi:hypothetical protein
MEDMNMAELKNKLGVIRKKIQKDKIIPLAIQLTRKYGQYETETHDYYTSSEGKFSGENISINYDDGYSMFGGGNLSISYKDRLVFEADRADRSEGDLKKYGLSINVGGFYILKFQPGRWERQLRDLSLRGPKKTVAKEPKMKEPRVSNEVLKNLESRFSIR